MLVGLLWLSQDCLCSFPLALLTISHNPFPQEFFASDVFRSNTLCFHQESFWGVHNLFYKEIMALLMLP